MVDTIPYFDDYGNMDSETAVKRLAAIAQEARLEVFRLLVRAGPEGMAAGDIARALDVPANTLSAQLLVLSNAGLVRARRDGRSIIYAINFEAMRDLLVFLTEDCCGGRAEMCAPLAGVASRATCSKAKRGEQHEAPARARRRR
jgi:ArsR family transcriptional regulator, arsenate/arsenite/antimonite-responsive transcriptional repressor